MSKSSSYQIFAIVDKDDTRDPFEPFEDVVRKTPAFTVKSHVFVSGVQTKATMADGSTYEGTVKEVTDAIHAKLAEAVKDYIRSLMP
jgi:hypothetical protein